VAIEVTGALRRIGARGLVPESLATPGDDMLAIGDVPHEWLFPRVAAVVHHGGAGTTGAALRAGKPSVIVPQAVDQPFWARAVESLGAGVTLDPHDLDAAHLAAALTAAPRAAELGRTLRREHGVHTAVARLTAAIPAVPQRRAA
jgi:UDP:flavonoid glycosyltransferase YjiC (YdhE family)